MNVKINIYLEKFTKGNQNIPDKLEAFYIFYSIFSSVRTPCTTQQAMRTGPQNRNNCEANKLIYPD